MKLVALQQYLSGRRRENEIVQAFQEVQPVCDDLGEIDDGRERGLGEEVGQVILLFFLSPSTSLMIFWTGVRILSHGLG